jgi:hypothetical protein
LGVVGGSGGGTGRLVEIGRVGSNFVLWREFIYTVRNSSCVERAIKSLLKELEDLNCFSLEVVLLFKPNVSDLANTGIEEEEASAMLGKICTWPVVEAVELNNGEIAFNRISGCLLNAIVLRNCIPEEAE